MLAPMKLIVGLGNPGKEYAGTRHNIGFMALDLLSNDFKLDPKLKSELADIRIAGEKVLLAKPTTFMNLSGDAVQAIKSFYKIENADILVVQDEMDLPLGTLKFYVGGPAGHNGVISVQERLGGEVARLRLGIGRTDAESKDYVLGTFGKDEAVVLKLTLSKSKEAILAWAEQGLTKAMNVWNGVESASK